MAERDEKMFEEGSMSIENSIILALHSYINSFYSSAHKHGLTFFPHDDHSKLLL